MSEIITDKLTGKTSAGDVDVTSEGGAVTMQLQQGLAKAWMGAWSFSTNSSGDSFNIASNTDNGTGDVTSTFSSSMNNADFAGGAIDNNFSLLKSFGQTSSTFRTQSHNTSYAGCDVTRLHQTVHGDLA